MEIDKVFSNDVDGVADNLFSAVKNSVSEIKAMQQRKAAENVQLVIQALKKIESDLQDKFDGVTTVIEKRVSTIKDGRDGLDGRNGRDGKDGRPGRDGAPGARGPAGVPGTNGRDGEDGVSVTDARIDFDGSLIISLSSGREINVGEVVAPDLAEKIKVITNGGGTSQSVLDSLASLQAQITALQNLGAVNYVGTWNASTNSPTITSGSGDKGDYYVVSVAGSTNIDGQTLWGVGDWIIFNGAVWQKVDGGSTGDFTNLSASGTVTFSGGTANGVAYLDGSKVLTTGSALVFDGTNLGVGTTALGADFSQVRIVGANTDTVFTDLTIQRYLGGAASFSIENSSLSTGTFTSIQLAPRQGNGNLQPFAIIAQSTSDTFSSNLVFANRTASAVMTEQMRLTSTGLGIGTTNPANKLVVSNAGAAGFEFDPANGVMQTYNRSGGAYTATNLLALQINFKTGSSPTTNMVLDSSGDVTINTGNLIQGTAGKGINFTANANAAGMTSELLNWYEEGTFTPTIVGTTSAGTGTYTAQGGRYTRIGRVVTFQLYVDWSAHTGTGNMEVAGLPFTSNTASDLYSAVAIRANNIALTAGYYLQGFILNNSTQIRLGQYPTGGGAQAAVPIDTAGSFVVSGQYVV